MTTRKHRRRIQFWSATIPFILLVLSIAAIGYLIGYAAAAPGHAEELPTVISTPEPTPDSLSTTPEFIGAFEARAYCPCVKCCGVWSAEHPSRGETYIQRTTSGTIPEEGRTIAADWSILPKGSEVIIGGHTYVVEDTGAGIKGSRIDIYFEDHDEALTYGVQNVDLYRAKS